LRGWNMGGDAKSFYERGIRNCFQELGLDASQADEYLAQTNLPIVDYADPYDSENDCPGRVSIGVNYDSFQTNEERLEGIITQKWICNFPMGAEAWTTYRRTGYPRLIPVKINGMADMGVDTELQIRRIPQIVSTNNTAEMASLGTAIGGDQKDLSIRVFWDVPTEQRGAVNPENNTPYVIPVNF
ncbi:MAG: SusD/RagB family nutrient-binding outer membrane lipoprotein, partial [Paramuribaculum sp.]|nr:SusD/RagB family nutrient-binding outer membrane lipoprotein [Paramuribaculum sp.]